MMVYIYISAKKFGVCMSCVWFLYGRRIDKIFFVVCMRFVVVDGFRSVAKRKKYLYFSILRYIERKMKIHE